MMTLIISDGNRSSNYIGKLETNVIHCFKIFFNSGCLPVAIKLVIPCLWYDACDLLFLHILLQDFGVHNEYILEILMQPAEILVRRGQAKGPVTTRFHFYLLFIHSHDHYFILSYPPLPLFRCIRVRTVSCSISAIGWTRLHILCVSLHTLPLCHWLGYLYSTEALTLLDGYICDSLLSFYVL